MAELNIDLTSVLAANANTVKAYGTAAEVIKAGQVVYLDTSATPNLLRLARANNATQAKNVVGIALDSAAGSAQPLAYATAGDVTFTTSGSGSQLVTGNVYVLGTATAGGIAPSTDPAAGTATFITLLGLATSPTNLRISIAPTGAPR
jgi:hypothetical protein